MIKGEMWRDYFHINLFFSSLLLFPPPPGEWGRACGRRPHGPHEPGGGGKRRRKKKDLYENNPSTSVPLSCKQIKSVKRIKVKYFWCFFGWPWVGHGCQFGKIFHHMRGSISHSFWKTWIILHFGLACCFLNWPGQKNTRNLCKKQ